MLDEGQCTQILASGGLGGKEEWGMRGAGNLPRGGTDHARQQGFLDQVGPLVAKIVGPPPAEETGDQAAELQTCRLVVSEQAIDDVGPFLRIPPHRLRKLAQGSPWDNRRRATRTATTTKKNPP